VRRMRYRTFAVSAAVAGVALLWPPFSFSQTADDLAGSISAANKNEALVRKLAGDWRSLRLHTILDATRATTEPAREAIDYEANLAAHEAERLDALGDDYKAIAAKQQALQSKKPAKDSNENEAQPLTSFLGNWRNSVDDSRLTIKLYDPAKPDQRELLIANAQAPGPPPWGQSEPSQFLSTYYRYEPAQSHRVLLSTKKNVWLGHYDGADHPANGRLIGFKKPAPAQMNGSVPLVVRQTVWKNLEWQLKLTSDDACAPTSMTATWLPGQLTWHDGKPATASVTGQGVPIVQKFTRDLGELGGVRGAPAIFVTALTKVQNDFAPLNEILRGEPFIVRVVLPSDLGATQGEHLDVLIGSTRVALSGHRIGGGAWSYLPDHPITIAIKPNTFQTLSKHLAELYSDVFLGTQNGGLMLFSDKLAPGNAPITVAADDGGKVDISAMGARDTIRLFDTPVSFSLYRIMARLDYLQALFENQTFLGNGPAPADISRKLLLIRNARIFLASYISGSIGGSFDVMHATVHPQGMARLSADARIALGLQYLELIDTDNGKDADGRPLDTSTTGASPDRFGVRYTSSFEKDVITTRLNLVQSNRFEGLWDELARELGQVVSKKKVLDKVLNADVDDLYLLFRQTDSQGRHQELYDLHDLSPDLPHATFGDQFLARTRVALTIVQAALGLYSAKVAIDQAGVKVGVIAAQEAELLELRRQAAIEAWKARVTAIEASEAAAEADNISLAKSDLSDLEDTAGVAELLDGPEDGVAALDETESPESLTPEEYKRLVGPGDVSIEVDAGENPAKLYCKKNGCVLATALDWLNGLGLNLSEAEGSAVAERIGIKAPESGTWNEGMLRQFLNAFGIRSTGSPGTAEIIRAALKQGKAVFVVIRYLTGEEHQIRIVEAATAADLGAAPNGEGVTTIRFRDVNAGGTVTMDRCHFDRLYKAGWSHEGIVGFVETDSPAPGTLTVPEFK